MNTIRLGIWSLHIRDGMIVCSNCGTELKDLGIIACETGHAYCSKDCAEEDVHKQMEEKS